MVNKRELKIILVSILIPFIITIICGFFNYSYDFHFLGIISIFSILGGPYGALGVSLALLLLKLDYLSLPDSILMFIITFLILYLAYKLWYSYTKESGFIYLDSIFNFLKLIGTLIFSSLLFSFTQVFDFMIIMGNIDNLDLLFKYLILNTLDFFILSLIITSITLVILSYFNVSLYFPGKISIDLLDSFYNKFDNFKLVNYLKNNPKIFDYSLICLIILVIILSLIFIFNISVGFYLLVFLLSLLILFIILIILKPLNKDKIDSEVNYIVNVKSFSLTEVLIMLFVVIILCLSLYLAILYYFGFLNPVYGIGYFYSFLIFLSFIFLFLIPFIVVLWYVEKRVTNPLNKMSKVLNGYFKGGNISKEDRYYLQNIPKFLNHESEVGILANVLSQMSLDLDEYIGNIKILTAETERINAELTIAHDIQDSFLPKNFDLDEDDLDISAVMIPAKAVGGDFYDFFMIDDYHFAFVIGDVSDKGVPAALFMVKSKQIIQSSILSHYIGDDDSILEETISEINKELCSNNDSCMFVTSWIGIIDLKHAKLTFVNAGHDSPIIKSNGEYKFLETDNDLVFGVIDTVKFNSHVINLNPGDKILLYTDGVTDANNENNEFFGKDNLLKVVKENDFNVNKSLNGIIDSVDNFTQNQEQFDDFTILLVEYNPKK